MNELDILKDVSIKLEKSGIEYMLSGSFAMSYYAEPRMTRDLDIIIALNKGSEKILYENFNKDYFISYDMINEAVANETIFNIIHLDALIKIDFIIRKNSEYRKTEFQRRRRIKINDFQTYIVCLEDLIISKLIWMQDSGSELQKRDIKKLLGCKYDKEYLLLWLNKLKLTEQFYRIENE